MSIITKQVKIWIITPFIFQMSIMVKVSVDSNETADLEMVLIVSVIFTFFMILLGQNFFIS